MPDGSAAAVTSPTFVQPRPLLRWLSAIVALAGWFMSWQLLLASAGGSSPLLDAVCAAGGGGAEDCSAVLNSQWASMGKSDSLARMPVAALGMAYFSFVGLWHLLVGTPTRERAGWHVFLLLVLVIGAWVSLDLIRVMAVELRRWCLGCLVAHALNGLLILLSIAAWPWRRARQAALPHPTPRLALAALIACTAVAAGHLLFATAMNASGSLRKLAGAYEKIVDDAAYIRWNYERQPVVEIPSRDDGSAEGAAAAPNVVVVFADFQCPACRQAHEILETLVRDHPDRLRVEYRHYPQDPECNPDPRFKTGGHPVACKAARAVEAALSVGGAAAFHELRRRMYAEQRELESGTFASRALAAGVKSAEAFEAAWYSPEVASRVRADIELARRLGVSSSPAIFFNGRRLENWRKRETWEALAGIPPQATQPANAVDER